MSRVVGDIAVEVTADITSLQREMAKGGKSVTDFDSKAKSMAATLSTVTKGVAAVGLAAAAAVTTLANVTRGIAETGDAAKRAGINFEDFQRLGFVARQNRIAVDILTDGIKEMQLRTDEFVVTGAGSASEALKRLGFDARDLKDQLNDPSELFLEITKRLENFEKAAQIRIADEVFGGSAGERFVELLSQGEAQIRATMQNADELGIIISNDVLDAADRFDRKFSEIQERVSVLAKTTVVELADAIADAFTVDIDDFFNDAEQAIAMLGEANYKALKSGAEATEDQLSAVKELSSTYSDLFQAINAATGPTGIRLMDVADLDVAHELAAVLTDLEREMDAFETGEQSAEQFEAAVFDLVAEAENLVAGLDAVDAQRFGNVVSALGAISSALITATQNAVTLRSSLPGGDPGEINYGPQNGRGGIKGRRRPTDLAPSSSPRPQLPSVNASFGVTDAPEVGGGGGGGGGGASVLPTVDDFEAFAETLASEAEKLEIWRAEQLEKLNEFRSAKLATEEEFNELEASIQREHADRLKDIEDRARAERVRAISGAFGDLSTLMQTENEKLFKIGKAAAIAEATVSGYQAAVDAWEKGMAIGGPPVAAAFSAASLARTGVMISKIASQQIGGGSSGGGGGGTSNPYSGGTSGTGVQTQTVSEIRFMGSLGASGADLVSIINEEYDRGNMVRAVIG